MNQGHFVEPAFRAVIAATAYASVVAAVVWLFQRILCGRLSPAWRHTLWLFVLVRLLLPALPQSSFSLFNAPHWLQSKSHAPKVKVVFLDAPQPAIEHAEKDRPLLTEAATSNSPKAARLNMFAAAGYLWFGVFSFLLLRLVIGSCWLRLRLARAGRAPDASLVHLLSETRSHFRTFWNPRLIETSAIDSPGLFGCFRPRLLLPTGISTQLSPGELRHVFLHELAHLKRGDLWINALLGIAQALHWFNPVAWLVLRRLRLERELACDDLVLRLSNPVERRSYGETILKLLERLNPHPNLSPLVGILEEKHSAASRLAQIAAFESVKRFSYLTGAVLTVALGLVGLSNAQTKLSDSPAASLARDAQVVAPSSTISDRKPGPAGIELLQKQYDLQKARVEKRQELLDQLRTQLGISDIGDSFYQGRVGHQESIRDLEKDRLAAQARYAHFRSMAEELKGKSRAELRKAIPTAAPDAAMDRYLGDLARAEQDYAAKVDDFGPAHPDIVRLVALMKKINQQIEDRVDGVLAGVDLQVAQARAVRDELSKRIELARKDDIEKREEYAPYFVAKRDLENEQRMLDTIYTRLLTERIDAQIPVSGARGVSSSERTQTVPPMRIVNVKITDDSPYVYLNESPISLVKLQEEFTRTVAEYGGVSLAVRADKNAPSEKLGDVMDAARAAGIQNVSVLALGKSIPHEGGAFPGGADTEAKVAAAANREEQKTFPSAETLKNQPEQDRQALYTRTYRLNPNTILENLEKDTGKSIGTATNALDQSLRTYFVGQGVTFEVQPLGQSTAGIQRQKAMFFNDRTGVLFVRATLADLDRIELILQRLNTSPHQVTIESKIIEIKPGAAYDQELLLRTIATNSATDVGTVSQLMNDPQFRSVVNALDLRTNQEAASATSTGTLREAQARQILQKLQKAPGVDVLSQPKVTTLSGRGARMEIDSVEGVRGPSIDLYPEVQPDGKTIRISATIDVPADTKRKLTAIKASASATVSDAETLVVWPPQAANRTTVILITPTLIDPAGNRIHSP